MYFEKDTTETATETATATVTKTSTVDIETNSNNDKPVQQQQQQQKEEQTYTYTAKEQLVIEKLSGSPIEAIHATCTKYKVPISNDRNEMINEVIMTIRRMSNPDL